MTIITKCVQPPFQNKIQQIQSLTCSFSDHSKLPSLPSLAAFPFENKCNEMASGPFPHFSLLVSKCPKCSCVFILFSTSHAHALNTCMFQSWTSESVGLYQLSSIKPGSTPHLVQTGYFQQVRTSLLF